VFLKKTAVKVWV